MKLQAKKNTGPAIEKNAWAAAPAKRASDGDRAAFDRLVDLFWEDIFRMVYYRTFSRLDAEDLTQDIFMRAYSNMGRLRKFDRFRPWLFRIAVNMVRDFQRKNRLLSIFRVSDRLEEPDLPQTQDRLSPLNLVLKQEFWERVREFSDGLPRLEREVFLLRFMDHLTISEIAASLKKNENTVKTHLYRAVNKFRKNRGLAGLLREGPHERK